MPKCVDCKKLTTRSTHSHIPFYVITEGKDKIEIEWLPLTEMIRKETKTTIPNSQAHRSFWFCLGFNKPLGRRWNITKERKCKHYKPKRLTAEDWLRRGL